MLLEFGFIHLGQVPLVEGVGGNRQFLPSSHSQDASEIKRVNDVKRSTISENTSSDMRRVIQRQTALDVSE